MDAADGWILYPCPDQSCSQWHQFECRGKERNVVRMVGGITSASPRDFPFIHTRACTTRNGATVTAFDLKPVGRTLGSAVLDALLSNAQIALW